MNGKVDSVSVDTMDTGINTSTSITQKKFKYLYFSFIHNMSFGGWPLIFTFIQIHTCKILCEQLFFNGNR